MADKAEKKEEKAPAPKPEAPAHGEEKKKSGGMGGLLKSVPALLGIVMVLEAAIIFAGFKMFAGPAKANADLVSGEGKSEGGHGGTDGHGGGDGHGDGKGTEKAKTKGAEVKVADISKAPNRVSGRTYMYDVSIFVKIKGDDPKKAEEALKDRQSTILDRIRTIIAQSDPEKLSEPGLETFKRQIQFQLDEILGEKMIEEVLVPKCVPTRWEF